jgi:aspartate/methionine/tyrosine aminotransferase
MTGLHPVEERPTISETLARVPPSGIRALGNIALGLEGVLPLYFGESNLPTPAFIVDAAAQAMRDGYTRYSHNAGLPMLRAELAAQYARLHGVTLDPETEIVVTASGLQALHLALRAIIDPGDEVLVLSPAWPNGSNIVELSHGVNVDVPFVLGPERYEIDFGRLEALAGPRARALLVTSPSNPLGWVATPEEQRRLLEFCRVRGMWLVCDEVYERMYWDGDAPGATAPSILCVAERDDAVVVVQSFSKTYRMTGWRLGWLVLPADIGPTVGSSNELFISHAPTFVQVAATAALAEGEASIAEMLGHFRANRELCLAALAAIPGITVPRSEGAFYLFPRIEGLEDSNRFCRELLVTERVGLAPGAAFGAGGEGSVRLCYAGDRAWLEQGFERLERFLRR